MRRVRIKDDALEQRIYFQRSLIAVGIVAAIALVLAGRAFWLQVAQHQHYLELSQGNRARIEPLPPNRGIIYDRAGRVIAENTPAYQLEILRDQAGDLEDTLSRLVRFGLLEAADVGGVRQLVLARRSFEAVPFLLQLDDEEVARYAVHRHELPGVLLETRMARHYPHGTVGAHALGYVGTISEDDMKRLDRERYFGTGVIGKTGVERAYEDDLLGTGGYREVLVNAEGRPVEARRRPGPAAGDARTAGRQGPAHDDRHRAAARRGRGLRRPPRRRGRDRPRQRRRARVREPAVLRPERLRARHLAQRVPRAHRESRPAALQPRAARHLSAGLDVKPLMALAGLEYDVIRPEDQAYCGGSYSLPGSRHRFRDFKREGHGSMDMKNAVMQSCDVYFYRLANTLGIQRIHDSMARMGFGEPTGIDIAGERGGIMPSPAWKKTAFAACRPAGLVPRRDRDRRHRPGLLDGDAAAARQGDRAAGDARPALPAAAGARAGRPGDQAGRGTRAGRAAAPSSSSTRRPGRSSWRRWSR